MKKFYNTTEIAEMYGMHRQTILEYINTGLFGMVRKGKGRNGHYRLSETNIETFDKNLMI